MRQDRFGSWLVAAILGLTAASAQTTKSVAVIPSEAVMTLDGRLDEPVWRDAATVLLVQQSPSPGEPTPYTTEVRVVIAGDRLYFGFLCRDPALRKLAVHSMQRSLRQFQALNNEFHEVWAVVDHKGKNLSIEAGSE